MLCLVQSAAQVHMVNKFLDKRGIEPEPVVEGEEIEAPPPDVLKFEYK